MKYSMVNKTGNRYEYTELATGSSDTFKKYNIYDMAGNMWEWTTEHTLISNGEYMRSVHRGASFACIIGRTVPC